ncbi:MAG: TIGR02281 family clan AA aspartic protease [Gammaproteobacteria bacterium]|nr:TIGR02281 family clan AA aspartic protease [Gammaproteobacteria bacterium]
MSNEPQSDKQFSHKIGARMTLFAWIIVLGMLTIFFSGHLQRQSNPNQTIQSLNYQGETEIILKQNRYGHYVATAEINQTPVNVILDTGATDVSIPENIANQLGLVKGSRINVTTANGTITVYSTWIDSIKLGDIILYDVRASINPFMNEDVALLGMSFLDKLEFTHAGDELVLKQVRN